MDLTEIEAQADALLERLAEPTGAADVRDIVFRLDGLYRGAQIKAATLSTGPCMDPAPVPVGRTPVSCVLFAGHEGGHRGEEGMSWNCGPGPTCGFKWKWGQGREQHYEICTLLEGHTAQHLNEATGVSRKLVVAENEDGTAKPVADHLHELVSYFRDALSFHAERASTYVDTPGQQWHEGQSKAYTDAAEKLEALLMEGGI